MNNTVNKYGWASTKIPESCDYLAPKVINILNDLKVTRVCDVGSGNGALAHELHQNGFYVIGIENDEEGVDVSNKFFSEINFYKCGVQDDNSHIITREGKLFDVVVSTEVVEHLFSPHLLPIFSKKLLKNSGYLVISTPFHGYFKNLVLSILNRWDSHHTPLWHGGHIKFWSKKTLKILLEKNGFKVINFYGVGRFPFLWKSMILVAVST